MNRTNTQIKSGLKQFKDELIQHFSVTVDITQYSHSINRYIEELLINLFQKNGLADKKAFSLLAVGGYGRRELMLHSDIDLLILHDETCTDSDLHQAQAFIQDCWDIGLDISHQLTTATSCAQLAAGDISVISTLMDMRLICGESRLMTQLLDLIQPAQMWSPAEFYLAKLQEQQTRNHKYGETAYNLEPNVKLGPGGLRDLQAVLTIHQRYLAGTGDPETLISKEEHDELRRCQHALWQVRFALHMLAGKREDRLLFEYQVPLAALFGFVDSQDSLAIEQYMKSYFQVIKQSRELTDLLMQGFSEALIGRSRQQITELDDNFELINEEIKVRHPDVFPRNPVALLELFLWIAKRPDIRAIQAATLRLLRQHEGLLTREFCASPAATSVFIDLFRVGSNPYEALHYMNKYGILGRYLDCFAAVTGQMQYDLFHIFTVDQHTLFVIRNMVRFLDPEYTRQFPLAARIMAGLKKRDILYLAALFHDIAKGRGGDHSELGAEEALAFATRHHLSQEDSDLLVWLVRHHLLMSQTAQRQDIYDPKTINKFNSLLPEPWYLEYLYLLTVADICATNLTLWTSWKDSLLKELYNATQRAQQEKKSRLDESALIQSKQAEAMMLLQKEGYDPDAINALWQGIKSRYFLHESADMIAGHSKAILSCKSFPLVLISPHHSQGGTEVLIYMPHRDDRFAISTTVLSNQHVTIQEATILTCDNQFDIDTYIILDEKNQAFLDETRAGKIKQVLIRQLRTFGELPGITKQRLSRAQAHFKFKPKISLIDNDESNLTCLFLVAADQPGLLARVSRIFSAQNIHLHSAKISTAGERAEDTFYISSDNGKVLSSEEKERLHNQLMMDL
ncbi:[protein-PII] uridylyltransferase [Legionella sp. CNM-4043-24]|uniref:[protein-PII] uridylyltransferase n=1 Tax=Legionella sp. CNM-4043-24 TaxID=3421646 RepID=UPI00403A7DD3